MEESITREETEIISMVGSTDDMKLAVIIGKNLIMDEEFPIQLFVYDMVCGNDKNSLNNIRFVESHRININEIHGMSHFSMKFEFKSHDNNILLFATQYKIFEFNFHTRQLKDVAVFKNSLNR